MVVATRNDSVTRILIPDSRNPERVMLNARTHTLGIIHLNGHREELARDTIEAPGEIRVSERAPSAPAVACHKDATVDALASLQELYDGSGREPLVLRGNNDPQIAAYVTFNGGRLIARGATKAIYQFPADLNPNPPKPRFLPLITSWLTRNDTATVTYPGGILELHDHDHVYVVNIEAFDEHYPPPETLEHGQEASQVGRHQDDDLRWSYWATRPATLRDLPTWLGAGASLPVPFFDTTSIDSELQDAGLSHLKESFFAMVEPSFPDPDSGDCIHVRYEE
jgi:hypothetical protein